MQVLKIVTVAHAVVLLFAISAAAQPAMFDILSNGQDSCGEFLAGGTQHQEVDIEWILGFISGVNAMSPAGERMVGRSIRDIEAVTAWVQEYCRSHPLDYMPNAAGTLRVELSKREVGR